MMSKSKTFILTLCVLVVFQIVECRQVEKRRKDKSTNYHPLPHQKNICGDNGRSNKVQCYCSHGNELQNASKAECWIFDGLTLDDSLWMSFSSQKNLRELTFSVRTDAGLNFIPTKALLPLRYLYKFTIRYANINDIMPYAFANLTSLNQIVLAKIRIVDLKEYSFASMPNLTTIYLEDNTITELRRDVFVDLPSLQNLYLNGNNIVVVHDRAFKHLSQLVELDLDSNSITTLTRESFEGLGNLKVLALRNNRISMLGDLTFTELWSLQKLHLDKNALKFIDERAFDGLSQLRHLSLSENQLSTLTVGLFEGVRGLNYLDLRQNNLETLTFDNIRPILDNMKNTSGYIYLEGNNFDCDCRLSWMHMLRNVTKSEKVRSSLEHVTCHLEPDLYGNIQLPEEELKQTTPPTTYSPIHQHHAGRHYPHSGNHIVDKNPHRTVDDFDDGTDSDEQQYDDEKDETIYDETQQDSTDDFDNNIINKKDQKHLFQIPINMLPCPEELRDSTDAPLSRLSQGEIKDFRHGNKGHRLNSNILYVLLSILMISL